METHIPKKSLPSWPVTAQCEQAKAILGTYFDYATTTTFVATFCMILWLIIKFSVKRRRSGLLYFCCVLVVFILVLSFSTLYYNASRMDFQNRPGGKTGGGGVASWSESNRDRRERLRLLALETIDLNKDPYFMKNHLGTYECKLCLTLHNNEGSYLAHTQGKKHQANLARRVAMEAKEAPQQLAPEKPRIEPKKFVKIGRPGYRVTKQRDPESGQQSLLFQVDYPEISEGIQPRHRFMSAYEQKVEPPDRKWQYLLFAAEPYETIAFKVPSREVEKHDTKFWTHWNKDTKQFFLQFAFKMVEIQRSQHPPKLMPPPGLRPPLPPPPPMMGVPPPRPPMFNPVPPPPPLLSQSIPPPPPMM